MRRRLSHAVRCRLQSPELLVVRGVKNVDVLGPLSAALGESSEALVPELRERPGPVLGLRPDWVKRHAVALPALRRQLGLTLQQLVQLVQLAEASAGAWNPRWRPTGAPLLSDAAPERVAENVQLLKEGLGPAAAQELVMCMPHVLALPAGCAGALQALRSELGLEPDRLARLVQQRPQLLRCPAERLRGDLQLLRERLGPLGAVRLLRALPTQCLLAPLAQARALQSLAALGMSQERAWQLVGSCPELLAVRQHRLQQSVAFLEDLLPGLEAKGAMAALVQREPRLLVSPSLALTAPAALTLLATALGSEQAAAHTVRAAPGLLLQRPEQLSRTLDLFREMNIHATQLQELASSRPAALTADLGSAAVQHKLAWLDEQLGLPAFAVLRQHPSLLRVGTATLDRRLEFLKAHGASQRPDLPRLLAAPKARLCRAVGAPPEAFDDWEQRQPDALNAASASHSSQWGSQPLQQRNT